MARWFRFYAEVVNDPKVQLLPCEDFRAWVNLLCLASENDGKLPSIQAISFALRMDATGVERVVERLSNGGLIDRLSGGPDGYHYAPHGWDKRQYKSDTSTERVKRFRKRSDRVSETPPETDTETDIQANACITRARLFDEAFGAYPETGRSVSSLPAARSAWDSACNHAEPERLLASVKAYAADPGLKKRDFGAPKFERWLSEERWRSFGEPKGANGSSLSPESLARLEAIRNKRSQ